MDGYDCDIDIDIDFDSGDSMPSHDGDYDLGDADISVDDWCD